LHTSRGVAAVVIIAQGALTVALSSLLGIDPTDALLGAAVLCLPLAFFVYRGHRWAMVVWLAVFTLDRAISISDGAAAAPMIIWWLILMPYFFQPLQVENARRLRARRQP